MFALRVRFPAGRYADFRNISEDPTRLPDNLDWLFGLLTGEKYVPAGLPFSVVRNATFSYKLVASDSPEDVYWPIVLIRTWLADCRFSPDEIETALAS